jgi:hypothetical protein
LYIAPKQVLESTKQEMYRLHQKQPDIYTPEVLADKFQIPVEKVKAILKLRRILLEKKESADASLNYGLAEFMDKIFSENEQLRGGEDERPRKLPSTPYRDPKIYATIEKNKQIAEQKARERREMLEGHEEFGKILSKDPQLGNRRHGFVIFDKSLKKVFVREKDGTLRNGTWEERERIFRKYAPTELV